MALSNAVEMGIFVERMVSAIIHILKNWEVGIIWVDVQILNIKTQFVL